MHLNGHAVCRFWSKESPKIAPNDSSISKIDGWCCYVINWHNRAKLLWRLTQQICQIHFCRTCQDVERISPPKVTANLWVQYQDLYASFQCDYIGEEINVPWKTNFKKRWHPMALPQPRIDTPWFFMGSSRIRVYMNKSATIPQL